MKLKCLVIDDDPMICDLVKHFCSKLSQIDYCISAGNGHDGLQMLGGQKFDLLLLDFHLPDMTGQNILEINPQELPVIMITSEKEFAANAYDYDEIYDFLVKPLNFERFQKSIERITSSNSPVKQEVIPNNEESFYVKDGNRFVKLNYNELLFLKAEENYVSFVSQEKNILSLVTLKEVEQKLPNYFMRVHRSYIVNLKKIENTTTEEIKIEKFTIPISQKYKKELLDHLVSNNSFKNSK
ncbi:MAG: LytTR family DNA-binding domain-containing protein [Saprospiraceae bacterium]